MSGRRFTGLQIKAAGIIYDSLGRRWNPALHPRDRKGRFVETGGVARLWGHGLVRVLRALPGDRVEVADRDGVHHTVTAKTLTMVRRPNGEPPTDDQKAVEAEDARRIDDPARGDGHTAPDHGPDGAGDHDLTETDPSQAISLHPDLLQALDDDELEAMIASTWDHGGLYDPATVDALADELDRRDPPAEDTRRAMLAADDYAEQMAAATDLWVDRWADWAAGGHQRKRDREAEMRSDWLDYVQSEYLAASAATKGQFFKPKYRDNPPFDEYAFFNGTTGNDAHRNKYASEELQRWFAEHGYPLSFTDWKKLMRGHAYQAKPGYRSEHG